MQITSVNITLWEDRGAPTKIRAFCSVIFENRFVVHDIKVIDGPKGLYVAMPSRRLMDQCPTCKSRTPYLDKFCGACGSKLGAIEDRQSEIDRNGKRKVYVDVAHPICAEQRKQIEEAVMAAYWSEREPLPAVPSYHGVAVGWSGQRDQYATSGLCVSGKIYASGTSWN